MSAETAVPIRSVNIVIPTLNAAPYLPCLIPALLRQETACRLSLLVIDSGSTDNTRDIAARYDRVEVLRIEAFSHGRVRNQGVRHRDADIVVFLSQDARPADEAWLDNLLKPFSDPSVAAAFSRQVPYPNATPMEEFFVTTHFPPGGPIRMAAGPDRHPTFQKGIFFSNVSSAVRRDLALKYPFDEDLIMSEDQQLARDLIAAGFVVVYEPSSVVFHSHRYTLVQLFRRYFDSVYSLTRIFDEHTLGASLNLGLRYLRSESWFMITRHPHMLPYYACYTMSKSAASILAHHADRLPVGLRKKLSLHRAHWDR